MDGVVHPGTILLGYHLVAKHPAALVHPQCCQVPARGAHITAEAAGADRC